MMSGTRIGRRTMLVTLAAGCLVMAASTPNDGRVRSLDDDDATLVGNVAGAQLGNDVEPAGDVDGDGHDDLIAGAWYDSDAGTDAGAAYLLYGPARGHQALMARAIKLTGERPGDAAGEAVAGVGDLDGDGFDDIAVGAPDLSHNFPSGNEGRAYLIYGSPARKASRSLSTADVIFVGEHPADGAGLDIAPVGDLDGDGFPDLVIGAVLHGGIGKVYVFYGGSGRLKEGRVLLGDADASFVGDHPGHSAGYALSGGDLDGDGHADLIVGGQLAYANGGAVHVVYGGERWDGPASLATAADLRIIGRPGDIAGTNVAAADVDGDGYQDVLVGAPAIPPAGKPGAVHVFYGGKARLTGSRPLDGSDAAFVGANPGDQVGRGIAHGDLDGDGRTDLVLGAYGDDGTGADAGAAYIVLGGAERIEGEQGLADIADVKLTGATAGDLAGRATGIVGDLSGDGCPDVLVSAYGSDLGGEDAGAVHVLFDVFSCREAGREAGRGDSGDTPAQHGSSGPARFEPDQTAAGVLPVTGPAHPWQSGFLALGAGARHPAGRSVRILRGRRSGIRRLVVEYGQHLRRFAGARR